MIKKSENTAKRLKQIMNERGLKQVDILRLCEPFCKKYGLKMGRSDLSQYISGKWEPRQDKLTVLALALGVSETWLMGYDSNGKSPDSIKRSSANEIPTNTVIIRGRDSTHIERKLTDEQIEIIRTMINALPEAPDDL